MNHNDVDKYERVKPDIDEIMRSVWPDVIGKYLNEQGMKYVRIDYIGMRIEWLYLRDELWIYEGNAQTRILDPCDADTLKRKLAIGRRAFQNV